MGQEVDPLRDNDDRGAVLHISYICPFRYRIIKQKNTNKIDEFSDADPWWTVGLAMIGKFQIAASFAVIYVYAGELMPTVVRSQVTT